MQIVFMGTPNFALEALKKIEANYDVVGVYTKPPKARGRGRKIEKTVCHKYGDEKQIPVFTPKSFRKNPEAIQRLKDMKPDIIIVAAYGLILPADVLQIPRLGCINIHGSLLPAWRGAAPIQRAIQAGDSETGVTIMNMDIGMDTGDMLLKKSFPITNDDTSLSVFEKMQKVGADAIIEYLQNMDKYTPQKQDESLATHAPKLEKSEGAIDWAQDATSIHNKVRAFIPFPKCWFVHNENEIKVLKTSVANMDNSKLSTGEVLIEKDGMFVGCGDNTFLQILNVQKSGKPSVAVADFLNGYEINSGEILV